MPQKEDRNLQVELVVGEGSLHLLLQALVLCVRQKIGGAVFVVAHYLSSHSAAMAVNSSATFAAASILVLNSRASFTVMEP